MAYGSRALAIYAQEFTFHVGPVQRCLFDRNAVILGVEENDERHRPHGDVAPNFCDEAGQLLIKEWRHMQQRVLVVQ